MLYMQNPFSPVQKAKFTPRESLGAAVVSPQWSPSSRTTASLSSRLNAVAQAPTLADDEDDNKTLVSFGTATKRFSLNQTIVSPVSQQQFKKDKISTVAFSNNKQVEQITFFEKQPVKHQPTKQQQQLQLQRSSYDHRAVPTIP